MASPGTEGSRHHYVREGPAPKMTAVHRRPGGGDRVLGSPDAGRSPSRESWMSGGSRVFQQLQEETGGEGSHRHKREELKRWHQGMLDLI